MYAKNILIVDDEPRTRHGLKKTLENWSEGRYQVMTAESAKEAIKIIDQQKIHLLITDIRMPEITGLELLMTLKRQEIYPVVIVISAYSEFEYAQEALRLGVINYLLKPLSREKLIEAVEQAIQVEAKQERTGLMERVVDDKLVHVNRDGLSNSSIKEAIDFVDQHYRSELTLKEVADHVHLNSSYFSALFKEQINVTFSEYVTRCRLQDAKNLLLSSNTPIAEISEQVGYKTPKYFIKLFKEYEGVTPSAYRKES
ncbi:response regulator [Radiobacillus sp. PE A8.2]|uniref:response regulator transcription factor n=1 Tax=Radiobacillus sp. PE A8.2 TaxID=3380349 RepID=UPI00388DC72D